MPRFSRAAAAVLLCLIALPAAAAEDESYRMPSEAQCKAMVDGMLQAMRTALQEHADNMQGADVVVAQAEGVVRGNRQRGASECDSWVAIGNLVVGH